MSSITEAEQDKFLRFIEQSEELAQHENHLHQNPYDVSAWIRYMDSVDDLIDSDKQRDPSSKAATSSTLIGQDPDLATLLKLRDWIGRRAVSLLPRSYKLWKHHWEFVLQGNRRQTQERSQMKDSDVQIIFFSDQMVLLCFERCLWTLSAYPRVWLEYFAFIKDHPGCMSVTTGRRTMNRALESLPVIQHGKLWSSILEWIHAPDQQLLEQQSPSQGDDGEETTTTTESTMIAAAATVSPGHEHQWIIPLESRVRLLRRYCQFNPLYKSDFAEFLIRHKRWGEAAVQYQQLLNLTASAAANNNNLESSGSRDAYWQAFSDLCTQHPDEVEEAGVTWEPILRAVLRSERQKKESSSTTATTDGSTSSLLEGMLWTQLADSWIRRGSFEIARSVYEEGLQTVKTVRDFSVLYDAYLEFEEGLLEAATLALEEEQTGEDTEGKGDSAPGGRDDFDILLGETANSTVADMELALARAEHLTSRRALLLNAVVLRQNPCSVSDWLQRADLYLNLDLAGQATNALEEALLSTSKAAHRCVNGRPHQMVLKLAQIYEESLNDLGKAQSLFDRICRKFEYNFMKAEDMAECWAAWVELMLRHEEWDEALSLVRQSIAPGAGPKKLNLTKSVRLWDLLLDLEESLGTVQTTKDAYRRVMEIKAATVQHVLNCASFLTDRQYFEESFAAYEKGIELFAFPHVGAKVLWKWYLTAFTNRYQGTKVERTRELFQRCLDDCPAEDSAEFFLMNGEYEEAYGFAKRSMSVYQAMCRKLPMSEKLLAYKLFIAKTTLYLGAAATRDIFQEAIDVLKDQEAALICLDFARMETTLQELERARAIYTYGAQMADPRRLPEYWKGWNEFEIAHGNEETFREMLRVKRSVEAVFSTINYNASGLNEQLDTLTDEQAMQLIADQEGVEHQPSSSASSHLVQSNITGFVPSTSSVGVNNKRSAKAANLHEIEARVAQLRKVTTSQLPLQENEGSEGAEVAIGENDEEINIDDIDAEIEEAAASGYIPNEDDKATTKEHHINSDDDDDHKKSTTKSNVVQGVETKAIPPAVFGSLQ
ncbi:hypothetical protein ACA910_016146 [Epithemia clementina (nom. ined.)]